MRQYTVYYGDGRIEVRATSAIKAFERALKLHPDKQPSKAICEGRLAGRVSYPYVSITYDAPKNLKLLATPPNVTTDRQPWIPGLEPNG